MNPPRRAYELRLKLTGDTWEDLVAQLRRVYLEMDDDRHKSEPRVDLCAGEVHGSFSIYGEFDPSITPEMYAEDLNTYVRERLAARARHSTTPPVDGPL